MRSIGPQEAKNPAGGPGSLLENTSAGALMDTTSHKHDDTSNLSAQARVAKFDAFDKNYLATLAEWLGGAFDVPPGGFFVGRLRVCHSRLQGQFGPTARSPEGWSRVRLSGADGVARAGDRAAPSLIHSSETDIFMVVTRDGLKPRRVSFARAVRLLRQHGGKRVPA